MARRHEQASQHRHLRHNHTPIRRGPTGHFLLLIYSHKKSGIFIQNLERRMEMVCRFRTASNLGLATTNNLDNHMPNRHLPNMEKNPQIIV
jgi:hypothetical protein